MKAIIYTRVSTVEQAKQGYSLSAQEKDCRSFLVNQGYEVDRVFVEEGESAKTQNRTQLKHLIKYAIENRKHLSALCVWRLDRLARNLSDQTELMKNFSKLGIRTLSVLDSNEENCTGTLMRNIVGAFSQYENELRAERTISGMKRAIEAGRWCWRPPLGYKKARDESNKPLPVPSDDSHFIYEAFELFQTGLHSQADIVIRLRRKGCKKITKGLLNRILRNPFYIGLIKVKWLPEPVRGLHKPIISEEIFSRVQLILNGKRPSITPKVRNNPNFPLRNFIRCPKCGTKLTAGWSTGHKGTRHPYYHCRKGECSVNVRKDVLETRFCEYLESFQPTQEALNLFDAVVRDIWHTKQSERIKEEYRLDKELQGLIATKNRIDELMIKDVFDEETYKTKAEELNNEIMIKRVELNEAKIELNDIESCLNFSKAVMGNAAKLWINADLNLKQRFQAFIFPDKIYWDGEKFGTTATSLLFKQLQPNSLQKSDLVAPTGFEPVFNG